jgi:hypothetical protein
MATTTSKRKENTLFFLPEENLNSPALPSQPLKLYRLITALMLHYDSNVIVCRWRFCQSPGQHQLAAAADKRQRRERAQRGSRCSSGSDGRKKT